MTLNLQDCTAIESLLDAYLDGELASDERASVEAHLRACDVCPQKLAQTEKLVTMLKAMPAASSKIDFADRFEIPTAATLPPDASATGKVLPGKFGRAAAVAAAVALCLGFGQYVLRHNMTGSEIATLAPEGQSGLSARGGSSGNKVSKTLQFEKLASNGSDESGLESQSPRDAGDIHGSAEPDATKDDRGRISSVSAKKEARFKPPVVRVAKNAETQDAMSTALATSLPSARTDERITGDGVKHSLVAFYASDPNTIPEELGISTDEDGLYAIKM
jgi:hypothetical protein